MASAKFEAGQHPLPRSYTTSSSETDASRHIDSPSDSQSDTDNSSCTSDSEPELSDASGPSILCQSLNHGPLCTGAPHPASPNITVSPKTYVDHSQVGFGDTSLHIDAGNELEQRPGLRTIHNDVFYTTSSSDQLTGEPIENHLAPRTPGTWSLQETPDKIGAQGALGIDHVTPRLGPGKFQRKRSTNFLNIPNRSYSPSEASTVKRCAKKSMDDGTISINPFEKDHILCLDDEISVLSLESSPNLEVCQEVQPLPRGAGQDALDRAPNTSRVESFPRLDQSLLAGIGMRWEAEDASAGNDKKFQQPKVEFEPSTPTSIVVTAPGDHKEQAPEIVVPTPAVQIRDCEVEDASPQENLGSPYEGLLEKWRGLNLGSECEGQGASDAEDADARYLMSNSPIYGTEFGTTARLSHNTTGGSTRAYDTSGQEPVEGDFQSFGNQFSRANLYQHNGFAESHASRGPLSWCPNPSGNSPENAVVGSSIDDPSLGRSRTLDCPFRKRNPRGNNCIKQGFKNAAKLKEHIQRCHNAQMCGRCFQKHPDNDPDGPVNECEKDRPNNMRGLRPSQWFESTRSIYGGSDEEKWWEFHFIAFGFRKEGCDYEPWFDQGLSGYFRGSTEDRDIVRYDPQNPPLHLRQHALLTPNSQNRRQSHARSSASSGQERSGSSQSGLQPAQTPRTSISGPLSSRGNQFSSPGENDAMPEYVQKLEMEIADLRRCLNAVMEHVTRARRIVQRFEAQGDSQHSSLSQLLSQPFENDASQFVSAWFRADISSPATAAVTELSTALESMRRSLERPNEQQNP